MITIKKGTRLKVKFGAGSNWKTTPPIPKDHTVNEYIKAFDMIQFSECVEGKILKFQTTTSQLISAV